jgi:2-dehydro-3-deoxygalactonokinase
MVKQKTIICCDWGTSTFRLKIVTVVNSTIIATISSEEGIAVIHREWLDSQLELKTSQSDFFLAHLNKRVEELLGTLASKPTIDAIVISGMASSSIGLIELPYAETPFSLDGKQAIYKLIEPSKFIHFPVLLISGLRNNDDVMRGEETQLIGTASFLNKLGKNRLTCILPGTHSKHVKISGGSITGFQTFITGELFQLLSQKSVLSNSVSLPEKTEPVTDVEKSAFIKGIHASENLTLLHTLFSVRTNQLFNRLNKTENAFYLSGILIGSELRTLRNNNAECIVLVCGHSLFSLYQLALKALQLDSISFFLSPEISEESTMEGQLQLFKYLFQKNRHENN